MPAPKRSMPFAMLHRDATSLSERAYGAYPLSWNYDPVTQVSDLIEMGGDTEPTTVSNCSGTTGVIHSDADQSDDDKGTD